MDKCLDRSVFEKSLFGVIDEAINKPESLQNVHLNREGRNSRDDN